MTGTRWVKLAESVWLVSRSFILLFWRQIWWHYVRTHIDWIISVLTCPLHCCSFCGAARKSRLFRFVPRSITFNFVQSFQITLDHSFIDSTAQHYVKLFTVCTNDLTSYCTICVCIKSVDTTLNHCSVSWTTSWWIKWFADYFNRPTINYTIWNRTLDRLLSDLELIILRIAVRWMLI